MRICMWLGLVTEIKRLKLIIFNSLGFGRKEKVGFLSIMVMYVWLFVNRSFLLLTSVVLLGLIGCLLWSFMLFSINKHSNVISSSKTEHSVNFV